MDSSESFSSKVLNKLQDFVTNPKVLKTSKITRKVVEISATLAASKITGPISIASVALSSIDAVNEVLNLPKNRFIHEYTKKHSLVAVDSKIPMILERLGVFSKLDNFHTTEHFHLYRYVHENKAQIVFKIPITTTTSYSETYWCSSDFKTRYLRDLIWPPDLEVFSLSYNKHTCSLDILPNVIKNTEHYLSFDHKVSVIQKHIEKTQQNNLSYAATLIGHPGSGKTSFVYKLAKESKRRLLHVSADITDDVTSTQFEEIVNTLQPDVLLLDDVDRGDFYEGLMAAIEPIREKNKEMVIFATCNEWPGNALMRPGRLGEILVFKPPQTLDQRIQLLEHYMKIYNVDSKKFPITAIAESLEHPRITQDYIRFISQKGLILEPEELLQSAVDLKNHWETTNSTKKDKDGKQIHPKGGSAYLSFEPNSEEHRYYG